MMTAKLFENGRSQAVRLPKECRFASDEVAVNKIGDVVILMPKDHPWAGFLTGLELFTDDCICWTPTSASTSSSAGRRRWCGAFSRRTRPSCASRL